MVIHMPLSSSLSSYLVSPVQLWSFVACSTELLGDVLPCAPQYTSDTDPEQSCAYLPHSLQYGCASPVACSCFMIIQGHAQSTI